ncbi:hypothetical protein Nmel_012352 [Mimus melanotis]
MEALRALGAGAEGHYSSAWEETQQPDCAAGVARTNYKYHCQKWVTTLLMKSVDFESCSLEQKRSKWLLYRRDNGC